MQDVQTIKRIRRKYRTLRVEMDERGRRQWAAVEAQELGWGGITTVANATGLSRTTVAAGLRELGLPARQRAAEATRVRRPGGGRRPLTETDPGLMVALEALIEPATRGDPESPLRWTCKSTRRLADIQSASTPWQRCFIRRATAYRPIARRGKEPRIPTATPSSSTSTLRCDLSTIVVSLQSR